MKNVFLIYPEVLFLRNRDSELFHELFSLRHGLLFLMSLFASEEDLQETIDFGKHYPRVQQNGS